MPGGRPPKPTNLKVLQGTQRPDRTKKNEPKPAIPSEVPVPPAHLDAAAKKEWNRLAPGLYRIGLLTESDLAPFEQYCSSYGRYVAAQKSLKKQKSMFYEYTNKAGATNFIVRPEVAVLQKEALVMKAFCSEFGLSPSARARMEVPGLDPGKGSEDPKDPFDSYLNGKKARSK